MAAQDRLNHVLRSSNVPFYETLWATAKSNKRVIAFQKRFYWEQPPAKKAKGVRPSIRKKSALVDVVADAGALWVKVSTVSENRLLFELARQGWEAESSGDDPSDHEPESGADGDRNGNQ
ncbi:hypothetical protein MRB53_040220 [Persea americana]|nr:hypothetical protein MRB53_040220 [Persea americana]